MIIKINQNGRTNGHKLHVAIYRFEKRQHQGRLLIPIQACSWRLRHRLPGGASQDKAVVRGKSNPEEEGQRLHDFHQRDQHTQTPGKSFILNLDRAIRTSSSCTKFGNGKVCASSFLSIVLVANCSTIY